MRPSPASSPSSNEGTNSVPLAVANAQQNQSLWKQPDLSTSTVQATWKHPQPTDPSVSKVATSESPTYVTEAPLVKRNSDAMKLSPQAEPVIVGDGKRATDSSTGAQGQLQMNEPAWKKELRARAIGTASSATVGSNIAKGTSEVTPSSGPRIEEVAVQSLVKSMTTDPPLSTVPTRNSGLAIVNPASPLQTVAVSNVLTEPAWKRDLAKRKETAMAPSNPTAPAKVGVKPVVVEERPRNTGVVLADPVSESAHALPVWQKKSAVVEQTPSQSVTATMAKPTTRPPPLPVKPKPIDKDESSIPAWKRELEARKEKKG
ncbi:hypothetical protein HDU93_008205 [Gonapodya sp. JEL0774]|nr:hypothetical protein HDU93_008205 [Gonapodya sp. JEL0774]